MGKPSGMEALAAPALRTPLSIAGSYATPFAMMGHHEMNGSLTSPGVYAGLHISPQMSVAAAAYGRSPMVRSPKTPPSPHILTFSLSSLYTVTNTTQSHRLQLLTQHSHTGYSY
nr:transducin-like enhancer protein 3-B [Oncorhynchus nerka]